MYLEDVVKQLRHSGKRITEPRRAVIRALLEDARYSSPTEVHARARVYDASIGLVTVYRTLELLADLGCVRRIHTEDGCHCYAAAATGHRHHLICRRCGQAVEFEGCDLSLFLNRVSQQTGYTIEDHLLELIGLCDTCQ